MSRSMRLDESGRDVYYEPDVPNVRIHFTRKMNLVTAAVSRNLPFRLLKRKIGRVFDLDPSEIEFYFTEGRRQFLCADRESIGPYIQENDTFRVEINSRSSRRRWEQEELERALEVSRAAAASEPRSQAPSVDAFQGYGRSDKTPKKLLVRLDRSRDFLSPDDIGLSVALCNETRRVAESGARAEDGTIRCMVTCCAREIGNISRLWCDRCGRLVCSTCLVAHVTNIESTSSRTPRPICLDCAAQIVDDIDPNVDSNLVRMKGFLQEHKIEKNMKVLEQRALEAQEIVLRDEAMEEFRPRMEHLRRDIKDLEAHLSELGGTPSTPVSVPKPVDRNVPKKALVATASAEETRKLIAKLEKQLSAHHKRGVPEGEVLLKKYFERQENLANQLEEAQVRLAVLESEKVQEETTTRDSDYSTINDTITAATAWIQRMEGSANRTSKEQQNMRGREKTQQLVLKELKLIQDKMQKLLPKVQGGTSKNGMESLQGDLRNILALLGQPNQLRTQYPNESQEAMAALDIQSPGNAVNNEPDVAECRAHLAAIGKPRSQWPLPLGLDFPTPGMNKRLKDLRSELSRQHAATRDKFTKEFSADLEQLRKKCILLQEDVNRSEKTKERQKQEERRRVVQQTQEKKYQQGRQTLEERRKGREMEARQDLSKRDSETAKLKTQNARERAKTHSLESEIAKRNTEIAKLRNQIARVNTTSIQEPSPNTEARQPDYSEFETRIDLEAEVATLEKQIQDSIDSFDLDAITLAVQAKKRLRLLEELLKTMPTAQQLRSDISNLEEGIRRLGDQDRLEEAISLARKRGELVEQLQKEEMAEGQKTLPRPSSDKPR